MNTRNIIKGHLFNIYIFEPATVAQHVVHPLVVGKVTPRHNDVKKGSYIIVRVRECLGPKQAQLIIPCTVRASRQWSCNQRVGFLMGVT